MKTFDGNSLFTELHLSFLYIYRWTFQKYFKFSQNISIYSQYLKIYRTL